MKMIERGYTSTSLLLSDFIMMADSCNKLYDSRQVIVDDGSESHL